MELFSLLSITTISISVAVLITVCAALFHLKRSGKPPLTVNFDFVDNKAMFSIKNETSTDITIENFHMIYAYKDSTGAAPSKPLINSPNTMRRTSLKANVVENYAIRALSLDSTIKTYGIVNIEVLSRLTILNRNLPFLHEHYYMECRFSPEEEKWIGVSNFDRKWKKYFRLSEPHDYSFDD